MVDTTGLQTTGRTPNRKDHLVGDDTDRDFVATERPERTMKSSRYEYQNSSRKDNVHPSQNLPLKNEEAEKNHDKKPTKHRRHMSNREDHLWPSKTGSTIAPVTNLQSVCLPRNYTHANLGGTVPNNTDHHKKMTKN